MTDELSRPLAPLPVNVRPRLGESTGHYIQRLAHANHLKPSYVYTVLTAPPHQSSKPQLDRLAALCGRSTDILKITLADADPAPAKPTPSNLRLRQHPALNYHGYNVLVLIRQNALRNKDSLRQIADMWKIPLWLLKRVLRPNFSDPPSPRNMMTEELHAKLKAYNAHDVTPKEAWRDLVDNQDVWMPPATLTARLKAVGEELQYSTSA